MENRVSISIADGVADVRLVRADKMNALDAAMFEALVAASDRLGREKGLRAVVLSGEGRAFCAGLDLKLFWFDQREPVSLDDCALSHAITPFEPLMGDGSCPELAHGVVSRA